MDLASESVRISSTGRWVWHWLHSMVDGRIPSPTRGASSALSSAPDRGRDLLLHRTSLQADLRLPWRSQKFHGLHTRQIHLISPCSHTEVPLHSLHRDRILECWQTLPPLHSLQVERILSCWQTLPPLQSLQVVLGLLWQQTPAPSQSGHMNWILPWAHRLQMLHFVGAMSCSHLGLFGLGEGGPLGRGQTTQTCLSLAWGQKAGALHCWHVCLTLSWGHVSVPPHSRHSDLAFA